MSDIFDELTRDVKDEKVQKAFMNILPKVIYFTVAIVIFMLIKSWISSKKMEHDMKIGDMFHKAISLNENGEKELARDAFDHLMTIADNSQKDLVELYEIKMLLDDSEISVAQEKLKKIFDTGSNKELTKSYARLLWAAIELNKKDSKIPAEEAERQFSLASASGGVFYGNGSLLYSLWLLKHQRMAESKTLLENVLKAENVPPSVKSSISVVLSNLSS